MLPNTDDSLQIPDRANSKLIAHVYNDKIRDFLTAHSRDHMFIDIKPLSKFLGEHLLAKNTG
jgi:hypothetical protein